MPYAKKNPGSKPKKTKKAKKILQVGRTLKNKLRDKKTNKAFKKSNK